MARSLLIFVPVSLREAGRCTIRRQKQQPACLFRGRHRGLRDSTNRPETVVSRHWWTAPTRPSAPAAVARRSHPRRNAAPTTHRRLRTADDRATPRPPTRQREPTRTLATPPPNNVPTPMPIPMPAPMPMPARTPMRPSAPGRNPILRKQTTRNQPPSHLPMMVRQPIPKPTRLTPHNRTARQRRRRTRSRL
jgi:hypothetical protein